jgi:tRNA U34 5-carboxymethylaminomethyl modifying enzyme MnmG/GidA
MRSCDGRSAHGPKTVLYTLNVDLIVQMSGNPAIGGIVTRHLADWNHNQITD